jgi:hypothetical protein
LINRPPDAASGASDRILTGLTLLMRFCLHVPAALPLLVAGAAELADADPVLPLWWDVKTSTAVLIALRSSDASTSPKCSAQFRMISTRQRAISYSAERSAASSPTCGSVLIREDLKLAGSWI